MESWYKTSQISQIEPPKETDERYNPLSENYNPWETVDSSFIESVAYFPNAGVLEIKMKSGRKHPFFNVPKEVFDAFKQSPSKGKFYNDILKKEYSRPTQA